MDEYTDTDGGQEGQQPDVTEVRATYEDQAVQATDKATFEATVNNRLDCTKDPPEIDWKAVWEDFYPAG